MKNESRRKRKKKFEDLEKNKKLTNISYNAKQITFFYFFFSATFHLHSKTVARQALILTFISSTLTTSPAWDLEKAQAVAVFAQVCCGASSGSSFSSSSAGLLPSSSPGCTCSLSRSARVSSH